MEEKIKTIFSEIFNINLSEINDMSSADNVDKWDSFNHTNLIVALEETFDITFTPDEIVEMLNFKLIKIIVEEKLRVQ